MARRAQPGICCRWPSNQRARPGLDMAHRDLKKTLPGLWRITRYFWPHLRPYRGLMAGSFLALIGEVGLRLLEPWPLKFVFDHIIGQRHTPKKPLPGFLVAYDAMTLLTFAAIAV